MRMAVESAWGVLKVIDGVCLSICIMGVDVSITEYHRRKAGIPILLSTPCKR